MEGWQGMVLLFLLYEGTREGQAQQHSGEAVEIVKRAAGEQFSRRSALDKNFIRFGRSFPEEKFSRVSRAAKDQFMRFGRPDSLEQVFFAPTPESSPPATRRGDNFMRFGRSKDNFMRFGRPDNFMRFGRKDNFMRFGRGKDNFMRFGKASKDNFIRFGRAKDNFIRFGRSKDNFMRFGRDPDDAEFEKLEDAPKSEDGFVRFGRGEDEEEGTVESGDLNLQSDKPKNGAVRVRRSLEPEVPTVTTLWQVEENSMHRSSRDPEIVEETPELSKNEQSGKSKRSVYPDFWVIDDDPSAEIVELFSDNVDLNDKRSNGGSGFIRFG